MADTPWQSAARHCGESHAVNANGMFLAATDRLGSCLWTIGLRRPVRSGRDPRLVYYHGIGDGQSPCFRFLRDETPRDVFESHLDYLLAHYRILPLQEAVEEMFSCAATTDPPVCSISFDDGLRSVYTEALPALRERGLPATVFLNTATVGNNTLTWVHLVSYLLAEFGTQTVTELFNRLAAEHVTDASCGESEILAWCRANFESNLKTRLLDRVLEELGLSLGEIAREQRTYLEWDQITSMKQHGITFCSHTRSHAPLGRLTQEWQVREEIEDAYEVLKSRGENLDFVSFPFGMRVDYGDVAVRCALACGHAYALEVGNGINKLERVAETKLLARVPLGNIGSKGAQLYSAIEVRPTLKSAIKRN